MVHFLLFHFLSSPGEILDSLSVLVFCADLILWCLSSLIYRTLGHIIFSFIDRKDLSQFESIKCTGSNLWKGDANFLMDRWEFWKER